ncbi:hypothetical protein I3F58_18890 [Streptomyces sp. MUM 203J]|uniref:hypothetical protein n=1 Tax=Streptomyces sp. MUM 203J TaxID=2791990 RepID=UPI001F03896C|nr:hypothetical protein [Streptomyces sp. MUM 203J]MCH0541590.1 hypothetical protein [Streptomyces sp. MUM 203J]
MTEPSPLYDAQPSEWGVRYVLCLPTEDAACAAADEWVRLGHRLTAVRPFGRHRLDLMKLLGDDRLSGRFDTRWPDPELSGWWQVDSLAVYARPEESARERFLRDARVHAARTARRHGGFRQHCREADDASVCEVGFDRAGLVHEQESARAHPPVRLPTAAVPPPAGPRWSCPAPGPHEETLAVAVMVAERLYFSWELAPPAMAWLLRDNESASHDGCPYENTEDFVDLLLPVDIFAGECTADTADAVPLLAELARDDGMPAGTRVLLLGLFLRLTALAPAAAVARADRVAALGRGTTAPPAADAAARRAVLHEMPSMLERWAEESDAARFVLAALAAAYGSGAVDVLPRLGELPCRPGTARADVVALTAALLGGERSALADALRRLSAWCPRVAEDTDSPHADPRLVALAALPDLVMAEAGRFG